MLTGEARIDAIVLALKHSQGIHLPDDVMPTVEDGSSSDKYKQEGDWTSVGGDGLLYPGETPNPSNEPDPEIVARTETKHYTDGSSATGIAPLPDHSPDGAPEIKEGE